MKRFLEGPDALLALVALAVASALLLLALTGQWLPALGLLVLGGFALLVVGR